MNQVNQEQLILSALSAYPVTPSRVIFLRHNENMVFQVVDEQAGNTYLLRIHIPRTTAFQRERLRPEGITSELLWLEALTEDTSLALQRPVRTNEGALVATVTGEQGNIPCSLLRWIEAEPFPSTPTPHQVAQLGTVIAAFHTHAATWSTPESFVRPVYTLAFYREQVNTLAEGVDNGIIGEEDMICMQETLELILATLAAIEDQSILIHADLWHGNLLVSQTAVHPIDFSLCGFGLPLFDLGTCLPGIPAHLRPGLLDAYQQHVMLPPTSSRLIDACFLLSRMGAYVYLLPNTSEQAWLRERLPHFVAQECQYFLEGQPLLLGGPF